MTLLKNNNHCDLDLDPKHWDARAVEVVRVLQEAGYRAYLVGGCVRDLLCHLTPKDFDVATDAKPEEIQRLFRRCRLIGRRFRLVHVYFGRYVVEVSTFRQSDDVFGTLESDAMRRDFTINALYLDPIRLELIDLTNGLQDLKNRCVRVIGDPSVRYQEDPVRILRAFRFAAMLDGTIIDMHCMKGDMNHVSPARLFDELMKLLLHRQAVRIFHYLDQHRWWHYFFPHTPQAHHPWILHVLRATEERIYQKKHAQPAFLIAGILWPWMQDHPFDDWDMACFDALNRTILWIPHIKQHMVKDIWMLQHMMTHPEWTPKTIKCFFNIVLEDDLQSFIIKHRRFRAAFDLLVLRSHMHPADALHVRRFQVFYDHPCISD